MRMPRFCLVILVGIGMSFLCFKVFEVKALSGAFTAPGQLSQAPGIRESVFSIVPALPGEKSLYVATRRGVYRSLDDGKSWRRIFRNGFWIGTAPAVAFDPGNPRLLYVVSGTSLFSSTDDGGQWHRMLKQRDPLYCVAIDPKESGRILIGTGQGIRAGSGRGILWNPQGRGRSLGAVSSIAFHPANPRRCFAVAETGLYRSDDRGATWDRVWVSIRKEIETPDPEKEVEEPKKEADLKFLDFAIEPMTGSLYLGTGRGILKGQEEGASWQPLPTVGLGTPNVTRILLDPKNPGSLYAATGEGLFYYSESRRSWTALREGLPAGPIASAAMDSRGEQLWVGTQRGLFRVPAAGPGQSIFAGNRPRSQEAANLLRQGSSIQEVQEAAVRYAEVMPEKIQRWRVGAAWRSWFPKFAINLNQDTDQTIASATSSGKTTFAVGPDDKSFSLGFGLTWDLANLVWNPDQTSIDVRSRLMVQLRQDILEEVTRLYFERKRLFAEFQGNPTEDPALKTERLLRIEELTAQIDALTGGWFSAHDA